MLSCIQYIGYIAPHADLKSGGQRSTFLLKNPQNHFPAIYLYHFNALILSLCIAPPHIKIEERTTTFFFFCKNLQLLAPFSLLAVVYYTNCKRRQDMVYLTCLRFFQIPQATTIYNLDAQGHQTFGKQPQHHHHPVRFHCYTNNSSGTKMSAGTTAAATTRYVLYSVYILAKLLHSLDHS